MKFEALKAIQHSGKHVFLCVVLLALTFVWDFPAFAQE